jgi:hypothetical protein
MNRFTEIWCPGLSSSKNLLSIKVRNIAWDLVSIRVMYRSIIGGGVPGVETVKDSVEEPNSVVKLVIFVPNCDKTIEISLNKIWTIILIKIAYSLFNINLKLQQFTFLHCAIFVQKI